MRRGRRPVFRDKTHNFKRQLVESGQTVCHYCGRKCGAEITADHRHPLSRGGKDEWVNIVPACVVCNNRKGNMTYKEFTDLITLEKLISEA